MALILNIDTAVEAASVCLAKDGKVLSIAKNERQRDHAAWLHVGIKEIFEKNHSFQFIRTHGKNLFQFFRDDKEAFEKISAQFEYKEDFEHEGLQNPIVNISEY